MRYLMLLSIIVLVLTGTAPAQNGSITVGGTSRTFIVYAPSSGLPTNPALVIGMHGLNMTASLQRSISGFDKIADREKFIVVYPQAISNSWDLNGTTDVNFIVDLIDTMAARYHIDRNRVYPTGLSMGGMMCYPLACKAADKFAAIGPASGYPMGGLGNCSPSRPVSLFAIHGEADTFVAFKNLAPIISGWVTLLGCPQTPVVTKPYPADNPNSKGTKNYYGPCRDGSEIILVTIAERGHDYAGSSSAGTTGINSSEEFWAFFKTRTLGPVGISHPAMSVGAERSFSAGSHAGKIRIQSAREIRAVRIFDIQGKAILSWKAGAGSIRSIDLPVSRSAGGIYLLRVWGIKDEATLAIAVP
jgi:poly(3-hydroxybutyrate) depolymerase